MTRNKLPVQQQNSFKFFINKEQQDTSLLNSKCCKYPFHNHKNTSSFFIKLRG